MKTYVECLPCLIRQAQEAARMSDLNTEDTEWYLRQVLRALVRMDWRQSPPILAQRIHQLIRRTTHVTDPYAALKASLNDRAEQLYPLWKRRFTEAFGSREGAVRLSIVGNLLDAGAKVQLDNASVLAAFERALKEPLHGSADPLFAAVSVAQRILYLADNAGEIMFDRALLEQLPLERVTLVVRGRPVINDATWEDAERAGLTSLVETLPNGSDAPGTVLVDCSPEFRERFAAADLILAKGQGNYESLNDVDQPIIFLLRVKCEVVARELGCPVGSSVLHARQPEALGARDGGTESANYSAKESPSELMSAAARTIGVPQPAARASSA